MKKVVGIEYQTAKQLVKNSRYIDKAPRRSAQPNSFPVDFGGGSILVLTSVLAGASGKTLGKGTAKLQQYNPSTQALSDTTDLTNYPVMNIHSSTIASGSVIICVPCYGFFFFLSTSCANVSS